MISDIHTRIHICIHTLSLSHTHTLMSLLFSSPLSLLTGLGQCTGKINSTALSLSHTHTHTLSLSHTHTLMSLLFSSPLSLLTGLGQCTGKINSTALSLSHTHTHTLSL